ncbi:MAG: hypothetical protein GF417_07365 [Candidatus Latescibacteria bacterium]|nr:hypothetical protein [bacterium]MBD3424238.1 hypothetical protein [Candidatus Latescibacterota bacterium]
MEIPEQGSSCQLICRIGGVAALASVLVVFVEILTTFLPGGSEQAVTAGDWLAQLQDRPFIGMRNLGLLNIFIFLLGIPLYLALFTVHLKRYMEIAGLALALSFIATAVFLSTNRAFSLMELSRQYASVSTLTGRISIEAAAGAMLSVGRSHSPGTFTAFFLGEVSGILISAVMLKGGIFSRINGIAGIAGFSLLLIYELMNILLPRPAGPGMIFAALGGIFNILWLTMAGLRLISVSRGSGVVAGRNLTVI